MGSEICIDVLRSTSAHAGDSAPTPPKKINTNLFLAGENPNILSKVCRDERSMV